ncbi:hypothetical protein GCM10027275_54060 [Rhabdobacter roseus]|uniref:Secretion system C-terminal sorting domain-containing protein n=1 Tax=Rhabdobacter roseus TaxID=1655419 RepID=A0A840TTZ4_9BACT|nr:T9SS type A sorting domain-containing protein [Rhabdobacter roseus]MBB5287421.1 hypothetical protein [Rhabdobacter roseus]
MKRQLLLFSLLCVLTLTARAQCPPGNVTFITQDQVDAFATTYPTCTTISGNLFIIGSTTVNLDGLSGLTSISGFLSVLACTSLTSLAGLHNLTSLGGGLYINNNGALASLEALSGLTSISGGLQISGNGSLTNLSGLNNVTSLGNSSYIENNGALLNLEALSGLTSIPGELFIAGNGSLVSLSGLNNVASLGGNLTIKNNGALTNLDGLSGLTSIAGNLFIQNNTQLSTCTILSICAYLNNPPGAVTISGNATGCASQSEVEAACSVLPVSLVDFTASAEGTLAQLSWTTAEESNSDYFQVEHSRDGKSWRSLGRVKAQGESTSLQHYTFTDADPAQGENLYRLRIVDVDGSYAYSRLRSLRFERNQELVLYPNPVAERLRLDDWSQVQRVRLFGPSGKLIQERSQGLASGLDMKPLPAGMYLVELTRTNGSVYTYRIVKQ